MDVGDFKGKGGKMYFWICPYYVIINLKLKCNSGILIELGILIKILGNLPDQFEFRKILIKTGSIVLSPKRYTILIRRFKCSAGYRLQHI